MKKRALNVFASDVLAGQLDRSQREDAEVIFTYRMACPAETAVSITMPVRPDQYDAMGGLLPIFEMNLPEGMLKERLRNEFAKVIPDFDDLDMLAIVGASQIGRLRYSHHETLVEEVPQQSLEEILSYQGSADLFAHLLERFARHSGISGIQPKVLVRGLDKLTHRGATHIVKSFDAREYPELATNEFLCTQGAAAAGITTARTTLSDNRQFLIVDRFDLAADGEYHGVEDFCVLEGIRAHGRYNGSYERIAKRIADFVSPTHLSDAREQFALMVAYACAIENGDAHLKNFGVLYSHPEAQIRLAPAYDIVSTTPYIPRDTLALTLDGSKRFPERATLLKFIRSFTGKTEKAAVQVLEKVATGVDRAIKLAKQYKKKHADSTAFIERLQAAFSRGLARSILDASITRSVPR